MIVKVYGKILIQTLMKETIKKDPFQYEYSFNILRTYSTYQTQTNTRVNPNLTPWFTFWINFGLTPGLYFKSFGPIRVSFGYIRS